MLKTWFTRKISSTFSPGTNVSFLRSLRIICRSAAELGF